jgi:hypothetical protein
MYAQGDTKVASIAWSCVQAAMARTLLQWRRMNPLPSSLLAFPLSAPVAFDATPMLASLVLVLALGAGILACAAWRARPRRVSARAGVGIRLVIAESRPLGAESVAARSTSA